MRVNVRTLSAIGHDLIAAAIAWGGAFSLRLNFTLYEPFRSAFLGTVLGVVVLAGIVFLSFGLYRGIWRYASLNDFKRIVMAVGVSALMLPTTIILFDVKLPIPRSTYVLWPILLILFMCGSRLVYRMWKEQYVLAFEKLNAEPVLVLGAGDAAATLIKELSRSPDWRIVGLLDDNPARLGRELDGIRILGPVDRLSEHAARFGAKHAIIAMPGENHDQRRKALSLCNDAGIKALTVPAFDDLVSGKITVSQLRRVELDDLLGRDPVVLDSDKLRLLLTDKVVLVTGAGGSIGSELCRQIARFSPAKLVMVDASEFALYSIQQEFENRGTPFKVVSLVGDCKDAVRIQEVIRQHAPHVVFHAAAYKHVPLMEVDNAWEAVRNNVLGTAVVAQAVRDLRVERFVLVSTDKAVNPVNVMGATKRLAEMVCQALQGTGGTNFVTVRFGNVLGSTGSVIPKFREQIARGGPVTVTDPNITRFFMSIPEACQLVLQAALMGKGGEIFVLDMGAPVKIADLARDLIRLSGFTDAQIKIEYTGLRPGEKLYEELLTDDEQTVPTPHPKVRVARASNVDEKWLDDVLHWLNSEASPSDAEVRRDLAHWIAEYKPQGEVAEAPRAALEPGLQRLSIRSST